ncbi:MAG: TIGR03915 family putative DNA repair protein [bacterium]|nr:TIGR03915 family putative DNA repair protein [bacterium]
MSSFAPDNRIYEYDGSMEGLFTCFSLLVSNRIMPFDIAPPSRPQLSLFSESVAVATDVERAYAMAGEMRRFFGNDEFERLRMTYFSSVEAKEMIAFRYIALACDKGKFTWCDLTNPVVAEYEKTWRAVCNERHKMLQFARFSKMEGGVYFAKINPSANVVPLIMQHFAKRFNTQAFMIYDEVHKLAGISQSGEWSLVDGSNLTIPDVAEDELAYQSMWRTFYDSICNEQRINPRVRMNFMPKKYWKNILEVSDQLPVD